MTEKSILKFGKWKGQIIEDLLLEDPTYIGWLEKEGLITLSADFKKKYGNDIKPQIKPLSKTDYMPFGQYKDKKVKIETIIEKNPSYIIWLKENTSIKFEKGIVATALMFLELKDVDDETYEKEKTKKIKKPNPKVETTPVISNKSHTPIYAGRVEAMLGWERDADKDFYAPIGF